MTCAICGGKGGGATRHVNGRMLPMGGFVGAHQLRDLVVGGLRKGARVPRTCRRPRRSRRTAASPAAAWAPRWVACTSAARRRTTLRALSHQVFFTPDASNSTWCPAHAPRRGAIPLPAFIDRSVRVKPLNRLHILPPWQRQQLLNEEEEAVAAAAAAEAKAAGEAEPAAAAAAAASAGSSSTSPSLASQAKPGTGVVAARAAQRRRDPAQHAAAHRRCACCGYLPQPAPRLPRHAAGDAARLPRRRRWFCARAAPALRVLVRDHRAASEPAPFITHEREPSLVFKGKTALEAWTALVNRRHRLHSKAPSLAPAKAKLEASIFGFGCSAVAQLIEQLPGAKGCEGFKPRYRWPRRADGAAAAALAFRLCAHRPHRPAHLRLQI